MHFFAFSSDRRSARSVAACRDCMDARRASSRRSELHKRPRISRFLILLSFRQQHDRVAVEKLWICAIVKQSLYALEASGAGGDIQWSIPLRCPRVRARTAVEQALPPFPQMRTPPPHAAASGRWLLLIDIRTMADQQPHDLRVLRNHGKMQGRASHGIAEVRVGAAIQQQSHCRLIAIHRGQCNLPRQYTLSPANLFLIDPDGKLLAKNADVPGMFGVLQKLIPEHQTANVQVDHQPPGQEGQWTTQGGDDNVARQTAFSLVDGQIHGEGAPLECLHDGRLPDHSDSLRQCFFFAMGTLEADSKWI